MDKQGTFIAFEGGEGSGKDTHIDRLKQKYAGRDDILFTREPGGTPAGEAIREMLMSHKSAGMDVQTEFLLFWAARAQLLSSVIRPALAAGKTVIANRFALSTIAYQIYGRERKEYLQLLRELASFVIADTQPHYILLDVTPEVGLERVAQRNDGKTRFDAESIAFHNRVREGYLTHIGDYENYVINADDPLEAVWSAVEAEVARLIG